MRYQNCWEAKKCGREAGGARSEELGVCPAASEKRTHGVNGGENGGRACWAIAGTLCGGVVQGSFAMKLTSCMECDFYKSVYLEHGDDVLTSRDILPLLGPATP